MWRVRTRDSISYGACFLESIQGSQIKVLGCEGALLNSAPMRVLLTFRLMSVLSLLPASLELEIPANPTSMGVASTHVDSNDIFPALGQFIYEPWDGAQRLPIEESQ